MPTFNFSVTNKVVSSVNVNPHYVHGNTDYEVFVEFDSEWAGFVTFTARVRWVNHGLLAYRDIVFTGDSFSLPALYDMDYLEIGFYAGDKHTTTPAVIICDDSILDYDPTIDTPDPDVYAQLLDLIQEGAVHGMSPYIGPNLHWYTWDDDLRSFVDTGITARGEVTIHAPYIGSNGDWYQFDATTETYVDSGVRAEGQKGDSGRSPYVGPNGNWWEWDDEGGAYIDTGTMAESIFWVMYGYTILSRVYEEHEKGKTVCVKYNDDIFTLSHVELMSTVGAAIFVCPLGDTMKKIVLVKNGADEDWGTPTSFTAQSQINDLSTIRAGAAAGATALQEVPDTYRTSAEQDVIDEDLDERLDAVEDTIPTIVSLFPCTYGTTTLAQIQEAVDEEKLPICVHGSIMYVYVGMSDGYACFTSIITESARRLYVKSTWGSASFTIAKTSDIPTAPTALADLTDDATHRLVSDTEKATWNGSGIFYCQKNVTPYADILAAHNSGKLCVCIAGNSTYIATEFSNGYIWFEAFYRGTNRRFYLTSAGVWHAQDQKFQPEITDLSDIRSNAFAGKIASDKLDYLVPYIKGQMWMFETDIVSAGSNIAPVGAKMASVNAIGMQAAKYNQLMPLTTKTGTYGITFGWNASEQRFRVTGTASAAFSMFPLFRPEAGKKYYIYIDSENPDVKLRFANSQPTTQFSSPGIFSCTSATGDRFGINEGLVSGQTYDFGLSMFVVDLTEMFGAGNEPTTKSDPRIAWLEGYLTRNVAYNAGTLITADAEKVKYGATEQMIPAAVRALPGYGLGLKDAPNELVRTNDGWKYIQRVEAGAAEGDLPTPLAESIETDITMLMGTALEPQMIAAGNKIVIGDEDMLTGSTVEYMVKVEEALS